MKNKYKILFMCILLFCTLGATRNTEPPVNKEGTYQISTSTYMDKKGTLWVFETIINTKTGKIKSRKQVHSKKYKNIK